MKNRSVKLMLLGLAVLLFPSGVVNDWASFIMLHSPGIVTTFEANLFMSIMMSILPLIGLVLVLLGFFAKDERSS